MGLWHWVKEQLLNPGSKKDEDGSLSWYDLLTEEEKRDVDQRLAEDPSYQETLKTQRSLEQTQSELKKFDQENEAAIKRLRELKERCLKLEKQGEAKQKQGEAKQKQGEALLRKADVLEERYRGLNKSDPNYETQVAEIKRELKKLSTDL